MTRSSRQKEISEKYSKRSHDNNNEGSSARTRPFNSDEIISKRKRMKFPENVKEEARGLGIRSMISRVDNVPSDFKSETDDIVIKGSFLTNENPLEEFAKAGSKKKEKQTFLENDTSARKKHVEKYTSGSGGKSTSKLKNNYKADSVSDRKILGITTLGDRAIDIPENEVGEKHSRDSARKDRLKVVNKRESETKKHTEKYTSEAKSTSKNYKSDSVTDKTIHESITLGDRAIDIPENEVGKKHSRDSARKDRIKDVNKIESETKKHTEKYTSEAKSTSKNYKADSVTDKTIHESTMLGDRAIDISENEFGKKHSRDSARKDRVKDVNKRESETKKHTERYTSEAKSTSKNYMADSVTDKTIHGSTKFGDHAYDIPEKEAANKHSRDVVGKDRLADRNKREYERRSQRNYRNGDTDKTRDTRAQTKIDRENMDSEISDRRKRKDSSKSHNEVLRDKRRRSKSREIEDKKRNLGSRSTSGHNRNSYQEPEHGETPIHLSKDEPGQKDSEIDKKRVMSNGLNSHYRRHEGSSSGIGGYSPRKRRSEVSARTPSPTHISTEKKSVKSLGTERVIISEVFPGLEASGLQSLVNTSLSNLHEVISNAPIISTPMKPPAAVLLGVLPSKEGGQVDSVQLTQATRPLRRLYIENVPSAASEKSVLDYFNNLLLASGANYIQRAQPCISCTINKDKAQALLEFLTPEDASVALSFDGISFSGSSLTIRRPKDFVEVGTGQQEKSMDAANVVSDVVNDSAHKIFIGGISKTVSSKMFMEIVSVFGRLKAYSHQTDEECDEQRVFLEYADKSVTAKACAGLNGMKLGGRVITAVRAIQDSPSLETITNVPFYGIPGHAKPLLEHPTPVLKLKNLLNPEAVSSMPESELEEVLDDVRLECARFGTIKSVNIAKLQESLMSMPEEYITSHKTEHEEPETNYVKPDHMEDVQHKSSQIEDIEVEALTGENTSESPTQQVLLQTKFPHDYSSECKDNETGTGLETKTMVEENEAQKTDDAVKEEQEKHENDVEKCSLENIFEPGCVFVEYGRTEASCSAAHSLHGRTFDDRIVTVEYVALQLYKARFPK